MTNLICISYYKMVNVIKYTNLGVWTFVALLINIIIIIINFKLYVNGSR